MKAHLDTLNGEIDNVKSELTSVKKELVDAKHEIGTLKKENVKINESLEDTNAMSENNLKYLTNLDRNSRRFNVIIFGVPEDNNLEFATENGVNVSAKNDVDKVSAVIEYLESDKEKIVNMHRLGKKGEKSRPIKVSFLSVASARLALDNSAKLDALKIKVYVKADKTKAEMEEFKRLGKRKYDLQQQYPTDKGEISRVTLSKGVLSLDGNEVDRYKPIQSIF